LEPVPSLILVALADGSLSATVETSTLEFGSQAVELAYRAARKEVLPDHFSYQPRLVTAENLTAVALQKLLAIADLPTRLVGVNRQLEQNRLTQMETSAPSTAAWVGFSTGASSPMRLRT
jgi:hypothetical protein